MKKDGVLYRMIQGIEDACYIWRQEMRQVFKDEGVLIFFILVPLLYPLLYSWIYNNETVHEVPVVVVDDSHSHLSREFIRMCDATAEVKITYHATDMDEAKMLMSRQIVRAIYYIPSDFQTRVSRMEQTTVSVYCDMSLMLAYKAAFQAATLVSQKMGSNHLVKLSGKTTNREEEIQVRPLDYEEVPIFNPSGGYGSAVLPAVLMIILQQTLVLGIGLAAGTARENNRYKDLVPLQRQYHGIFRIVLGKTMCYLMIYIVVGVWLSVIVPRIFHFPCLAHWQDLLVMMIPYTLACIFFGICVSCIVRYRENVMLLMVFVSIPLLFLSGASWPQSNIPGFWQGISWLFPSTFGVRAYIRLNSMGGTLSDVLTEYRILWIQVAAYFILACLVYRHQIRQARFHALERLDFLMKRKEQRKKQA